MIAHVRTSSLPADTEAMTVTWSGRTPAVAAALVVLSMPALHIPGSTSEGASSQAELLVESTLTGRGNFIFDTRLGEPAIPADLRANLDNYPEYDTYVLQFVGPVYESWISELQALGVEVFDYLPDHSFIVAMAPEIKEKAADLPFVRWMGTYHPAYKFVPDLIRWVEGVAMVELSAFPGRPTQRINETIRAGGGSVLTELLVGGERRILAELPPGLLAPLAALPEVSWIEPVLTASFLNEQATWVVQTNTSSPPADARRIHSKGINGTGQLVTVADTGLDVCHEMFAANPGGPCSGASGVGPSHRKVLAYLRPLGGCANFIDEGPVRHGTHVSGTVAGDAPTIGQYGVTTHDGHAFGARIILQDLENRSYPLNQFQSMGRCDVGTCLPFDLITKLWQPAFDLGSHVHSNSWGPIDVNSPSGPPGSYCDWARQADQFMWDHPTFMILFAAGNGGNASDTTLCTGSAKDIITVGATFNGASAHNVPDFSSRGPADDGRLKPTLVAPGQLVWSACPNCNPPPYRPLDGTSFSTPGLAGSVALVREYFVGGWYPTGSPVPSSSMTPSAALLKAVLINGAIEIGGAGAYANSESHYPNNNTGWGRIHLDNALYFTGDPRRLVVLSNDNNSLSTGQWKQFYVWVETPGPFEATLVWTDRPGTLGAAKAIVNDLDLVVVDPSGNLYRGNAFRGRPAESATGGSPDRTNVEEGVLRLNATRGVWTIKVAAKSVPQGPQAFSLVVTGGLDPTKLLGNLIGVSISPASQIAYFNPTGCLDAVASFTASPSGSYAFVWDFGDSSTGASGVTQISHTYPPVAVIRTVRLTVIDSSPSSPRIGDAPTPATVDVRKASFC